MEILKKSYSIIFILLVLIIVMYFKSYNLELKSFSLNLITEIIGIIITVFLIDNVIKQREKKEKIKILKSAYLQFRRPIYEILHLLVTIYKASAKVKPDHVSEYYKEIFSTEDFFESIKYLDFLKKAPVTPTQIWANYISYNIKSFHEKFDKILDKYNFVLDSKIITEMESISNSTFLQILNSGQIILLSDVSRNYKREHLNILAMETLSDDLKVFLDKLFELNNYFGKMVDEETTLKYDVGLWLENIAPKIGNSRVDSNN